MGRKGWGGKGWRVRGEEEGGGKEGVGRKGAERKGTGMESVHVSGFVHKSSRWADGRKPCSCFIQGRFKAMPISTDP